MTAGGNNAGFGSIVDNCIYHADPREFLQYGAPYDQDRDGAGQCKISLSNAQGYLNNSRGGGLAYDLERTLPCPCA